MVGPGTYRILSRESGFAFTQARVSTSVRQICTIYLCSTFSLNVDFKITCPTCYPYSLCDKAVYHFDSILMMSMKIV